MKKQLLLFFTFSLLLSAFSVNAQTCSPDPNGCTDYSNAFLNSTTAATLEYDNVVSMFHSSGVRSNDGTWMVWGEGIASDGVSNILIPQAINSTNYPGLTGTVLKFTAGSFQSNSGQNIVLTTTGLFVWGTTGTVLSSSLVATTAFQPLTVNGNATGLPAGVSPSQVKMIFATYQTLAIVTCGGAGYVLAQNPFFQGDGSAGNSLIWHQVLNTSSVAVTGIVAIRGCGNALMLLTSGGAVRTWGRRIYLGNGTAVSSGTRSVAMTLPAGVTIKMIGCTGSYSQPTVAYYLLATNGNLYCMGDNGDLQLGDFTTTARTGWAQPLLSAGGSTIPNIAWIAPNGHDGGSSGTINNSINVLTTNGTLYAWGDDDAQMLGGPVGNAPMNPTAQPGGLLATDQVIAVSTGGHFSMIWKKCTSNFAFAGHRTNGSAASGSAAGAVIGTYDFSSTLNTFSICTEPIIPTLTASTSSICQGSATVLTPGPAGGTFSVLSANATMAGNTATITAVDTVQIQYTYTPSGCAVVDTLYQYDYGNLTTATWPIANASALATNAAWLGNISPNTDCGTNTSDAADGFTIANAISGGGTQASPWILRGANNYTFQVTVNGSGTAKPVYWAVWYDVNSNGNFTDAEDFFQTGNINHGSPVNTSFSVTVPTTGTAAGASAGKIRIIGAATNPTFAKAMNGTGSFVNGEVEDYYVSYPILLPLTLTNFTASKQINHSLLNWQTASEQNTKDFIIERSANGNNYVSLGTIAAAGNSTSTRNYFFTDNNPISGANYYRLKMVDIDGHFKYSDIRVLNFGNDVNNIILTYPNPAKDKLTVTGIEAGMQLRLMNNVGQQLTNILSTGNTMQVDVSKYASGIYILQIVSKDEVVKNVKIIKN
ncbi:MAG: T9SS type A sorting domain-containing protein [Chitinophagaceae bacterium]